MKALASVVLVFAVCISMVQSSSAAGPDKQLSNVRGDVSVQSGTAAPQPVAKDASVSISDQDFAVTGGIVGGVPSQGAITLADSSRILIGHDTRVQMVSFDNIANVNTAKFILVNGKLRFVVQHPAGAKANYTFTTPTGQIAVRGTVGDIATSPTQLQVNVYQLTNPALPVQVTMNSGQVFTLAAGQTLTVSFAGAAVAGTSSSTSANSSVTSTTQTQTSEFSEFGSPAQAVAGAAAGTGAAAATGGIPAAAAIGAGVVALGGVIVGTTGSKGTSSPAPPPPPANVQVSPSTLSFTPGTGPLHFTASESGYSGGFQASIDNPSVATVSGGPANFTVTPKTDGTATIHVSDTNGHTAPVGVTVSATTIVVPGSLPTFTTIGQTQKFTAQETYYAGTFNAVSGNKAIATVNAASSSGSGQFTVTAAGTGSTSITVSDGLGHSSPVGVTVAVKPSPTPTSIPICIGARPRNERDRFENTVPRPAATATCPPTPMIVPPVVVHKVVPPPQPRPVGPQPPVLPPAPGLPGHPTPPPMPGNPPQGD